MDGGRYDSSVQVERIEEVLASSIETVGDEVHINGMAVQIVNNIASGASCLLEVDPVINGVTVNIADQEGDMIKDDIRSNSLFKLDAQPGDDSAERFLLGEPQPHPGVPEVVASETVVTTTNRQRKQKLANVLASNRIQLVHETGEEVEVEIGDFANELDVWAKADYSTPHGDLEEEDKLGSGAKSFVAIGPYSSMMVPMGMTNQETEQREPSLREITKRERDREKKREYRQNPIYREREKNKARERMRAKRQDPMYRSAERVRDRMRRRTVRQDSSLRERERERDKMAKRTYRNMSKYESGEGLITMETVAAATSAATTAATLHTPGDSCYQMTGSTERVTLDNPSGNISHSILLVEI